MVKDAESHSEEDQERRQKVDAHNRLDQLIYTTEKTFDEHKDKLPAEEKGNLERAVEEAKQALESDDLATLEGSITKLTEASHKLAEVMYQTTGDQGDGAAPQDPTAADSGSADEEVIDAEYVDVEESK
jgi:molecular chaperone DnaK